MAKKSTSIITRIETAVIMPKQKVKEVNIKPSIEIPENSIVKKAILPRGGKNNEKSIF